MTFVGGLLVFAVIWFVVDKATRNHPGRKARDERLKGPWPTSTEPPDSGGWGGDDSGGSDGDSGGDGGGD